MESYNNSAVTTRNGLELAKPNMPALNEILPHLNPTGISLSEIDRAEVKAYKLLIQGIRKWVIAAKLFGNPAATFAPSPADFINSTSLESNVSTLNVPEGRFRVIPIEPTLNLKFIMAADSSMSLENAIEVLKRNLAVIRSRSRSANFFDDMELRKIVIKGLFDVPSNDEPITVELINLRVKAFERIAEGVVRSMYEGKETITDPIASKAIKAWIMAKQMVEIDGWKNENVKFGVLALPAGITLDLSGNSPTLTPPATLTAKTVTTESTGLRSNSTASTDSDKSSSSSSKSSIAGGIMKMFGIKA